MSYQPVASPHPVKETQSKEDYRDKFTVDVWVKVNAAGETAGVARWGARGAGRGSSASAWGASAATGRGAAPAAAATRWAMLVHRGPAAAALLGTSPTPHAFPLPHQPRPRTAAVETAATAAPSTSAPSGLCGERTINMLLMIVI